MIAPNITWTKNGKEFEFTHRFWALPSVHEVVGKNPMGVRRHLMKKSSLKFEAISGIDTHCCEDGFLWDEIRCKATHSSFKKPISKYFKLVYDGLTIEKDDGYAAQYP